MEDKEVKQGDMVVACGVPLEICPAVDGTIGVVFGVVDGRLFIRWFNGFTCSADPRWVRPWAGPGNDSGVLYVQGTNNETDVCAYETSTGRSWVVASTNVEADRPYDDRLTDAARICVLLNAARRTS